MPDQLSFSEAEQGANRKNTWRELFLDEMDQVVPWAALEAVIESFYPRPRKGRHPYPLRAMLRIHLMQQWYALSDAAMEEALYKISSMRRFAPLSLVRGTRTGKIRILSPCCHAYGRSGVAGTAGGAGSSCQAADRRFNPHILHLGKVLG
jgi:hypothetical protein